ncbi:hypothetical protein IQ251_00485 [Saccharopolyspora sp. HNM0983]|uniref:Secreted protein n=1 Tax=Saccharopolyspora montiporae TaxID=2781240 RepID=A0A929B4B1_9PSEU|nr:hypothetical protein [Saccharopolyspora sp. HNM0983]MBE9372914.1 hypothetical protein [Saccharopolyspora sp. HNM0983]
MSTVVRRCSLALAAAAMLTGMAATGAAAAPVAAGSSPPAATAPDTAASNYVQWKRLCGTTYAGYVESGKALTGKADDGSCDGHAWVRVKYKTGNWSAWKSGATSVKIDSPGNNIVAAQHKGCGSCDPITTEP